MWIQTEDYPTPVISLGASPGVVSKIGKEGNPAKGIFLYLVLWAAASPALTAAVF